jgi:hypothetical protein
VAGDTAIISGGANAGTRLVVSTVNTDLGAYIIVDGANLTTEGAVGATISLLSKYAVLPKYVGLEMTPDQVDVAEFESKYNQFSSSLFEYDFFIKDQVNGNEFINEQILYPSGAYSLPRKAKTSIGLTLPPLNQLETKVLDDSNIQSPGQLKIDRNISKNFYNAVVYKYNKDEVTEKYAKGKIRQSSDSTNRIRIANKTLTIESDGIKQDANFTGKFDIQAKRFLNRYQYAAESISVEVDYGTGFAVELGDSVILDGRELNLSDTKDENASRTFQPRLFEVQNKVLNLKGTPIKLDLVDTAFSLNGRYGVFSPSSKVDAGSTTTTIVLKDSFGTVLTLNAESFKWVNYLGYKVRVRSADYTFDEEVTLSSIDPTNDNAIIVSPALSAPPSENYIVDIVTYPAGTDATEQSIYKNIFCYWNNQLSVLTGVSGTVFTVSAPTAALLAVGYTIKIHDDTYTNDSEDTTITDITGTTITVADDLGFTPAVDYKIEVLTWPDNGAGYRFL